MPSHRITTKVEDKIEEILERKGGWPMLSFDLQPVLTPQGTMHLAIVFVMPGAILGTMVSAASVVQNPAGITEAEIEKLTADLIEGLEQSRSKQLAGMDGQSVLEPS